MLCPLAAKHSAAHTELAVTDTPLPLSAELLCSHLSPSLFPCLALRHPMCRTQCIPLLNFITLMIAQCPRSHWSLERLHPPPSFHLASGWPYPRRRSDLTFLDKWYCWLCLMMAFFVTCFSIYLRVIFSITFPGTRGRLTGQCFPGSSHRPFMDGCMISLRNNMQYKCAKWQPPGFSCSEGE